MSRNPRGWSLGTFTVMPRKRDRDAEVPAADSLAPQYPIESVDNALKLLLLLGERPEIRLSEATRYLGVASSTAHRLLAMLAYRGFVRQDPVSKAYLPGPSLTGVAFAIFGRVDIQRTAMPIMRRLSEQLRETVHVGMLDGAGVRFVAAVEGPAAVRVASRLGRTLPAHCTSTGKVMLAQLPEPELRQLLPHERLERITPSSIGTRTELEAELAAIRERGYAINREESEEGVASVAVPIPTRAPGLRLALNAAAPQNRLDSSGYGAVAAALVKAAKDIGDQLG
ncbi:IclR family transcriptional regulator [Mycobacterium europaeum]|uniref:IclR family transcriptional regulator n=2 Tax=Mycobacterium europaeum TaxID=761804 RepID=A0A0U1DSR8_9MYCO|nr:IclR family transcriptional regulator [Mycobacterium europaeum]